MSITVKEATDILLGGLPSGIEQFYDLQQGKILQFYQSIGATLKQVGFDLVDILQNEVNPATMLQQIPSWENALGLSQTITSRFGTLIQRRNQVIGKLRENGGLTLSDLRAAMQPYLLYADPNQIQILEPNRAILKTMHTYTSGAVLNIPASSSASVFIRVLDDPKVSPAGAFVNFKATSTNISELAVTLHGIPTDGIYPYKSLGSGASTALDYTLGFKIVANQAINKIWEIEFSAGAVAATISNVSIFIEGLGRNYDILGREIGEGLGAAMFTFAIVVDMAKVGTGYNLDGAKTTLQRMTPAHCDSALVIKPAGGTLCAIPDLITTLPDLSIPCDDLITIAFTVVPTGVLTSLYGIWGSSSTSIWIVGGAAGVGTLLYYDGVSIIIFVSPVAQQLLSVWGVSSNYIFSVGDNGTILFYNGVIWASVVSPTANQLRSIFGVGPNEIYAVGILGTIIHYDGFAWSTVASPTGNRLNGVWGYAPDSFFAVGNGGTIISFDGVSWTSDISPIVTNINSVWGVHPGDIWAVGDGGKILHYNGSAWSDIPSPTLNNLLSVYGSSSTDIYAVGTNITLHYDGSNWSIISSLAFNENVVWSYTSNDIWIAGGAGQLYHGSAV